MDFHTPVLCRETIELLSVKPNGIYIDATLGNGGHTIEILKKGGIVYGIDQDPNNLKLASNRIKDLGLDKNFHPVHSNFNRLNNIKDATIKQKVDGLLVDLGLSQNQQINKGRGFSFNDNQSFDMRLDPQEQSVTAEEIINTASFDELYEIFTKYGQELYSKPLILRIIRERQKSPIKNGQRLADIVRNYYQEHHIKTKIDPSTKIFLSLRIAVNNELENLKNILVQSLDVVASSGNICIITFHSGEDRIVKSFIKEYSDKNIITSNSKALKPTYQESSKNPLSRSATLRSYKII